VPGPRGWRRYWQGSIAVLMIGLTVVGVIALKRATPPAAGDPQRNTAAVDSATLAAAAQSRQQAASWIAAQVSRGVIISCDPLMCAALAQHGFPAANLATIGPNTADPLGSGIVVATAAIRSQFGSRLASVYAPLIIAEFGTGSSQVQVRVIAPDGTAVYLAAEQTDLRAREAAGRQLLGNKNVHLPAGARVQLADGLVDTRILITLAGLAHRYPLTIHDFGDAGPGAQPTAPLRSLSLSTPSATYLRQVQAFLHAQRAPLLALTSVQGQGKSTVLTIEFTAPSPLGLLSQG
jgi:hypothetical protein